MSLDSRDIVHIHQPMGLHIITIPKTSILFYNNMSKGLKFGENQFKFLAAFIKQLKKILSEGYTTIYFINDGKETLKFIEQSIYYMEKNNLRFKIIIYTDDSLPHFFTQSECFIHYYPKTNSKSKVAISLLPKISKMIRLTNENDPVLTEALQQQKEVINVMDYPIDTDIVLHTTLNMEFRWYGKPVNSFSIDDLNHIVDKYLLPDMYDYKTCFSDSEKSYTSFKVTMPYTFTVNTVFDSCYRSWWECFEEIKLLIGKTAFVYIGFGLWRAMKTGLKYRICSTFVGNVYNS